VLGANVRKAREARGMTQFQVAAAAGFVVSTISDIERGATDPQISTIRRIARVLGVTAADLVDEDEPVEVAG